MNYYWDLVYPDSYSVPLPNVENDAEWEALMLEWLEGFRDYYLFYNYFPYFMTPSGHC